MKLNLTSVYHMFKTHIFLSGTWEGTMEIFAIFSRKFCTYPCLDHLNSQVVFMLTNILASISCIKRNHNLAYVFSVPKSKKITFVCLHLGHSVHRRRLQTSGSHGLSSVSTSADAPLLAEREKSQTKIYWHCQLPWQTDPQSQCPSHSGGGHPCVRCIKLIFPLDNHNFFQAVDKTNR